MKIRHESPPKVVLKIVALCARSTFLKCLDTSDMVFRMRLLSLSDNKHWCYCYCVVTDKDICLTLFPKKSNSEL